MSLKIAWLIQLLIPNNGCLHGAGDLTLHEMGSLKCEGKVIHLEKRTHYTLLIEICFLLDVFELARRHV